MPVIEEELMTEGNNEYHEHTVTIRNDGYIVGNLPHLFFKVPWLMVDLVLVGDQASRCCVQISLGLKRGRVSLRGGLYSSKYGTTLVTCAPTRDTEKIFDTEAL